MILTGYHTLIFSLLMFFADFLKILVLFFLSDLSFEVVFQVMDFIIEDALSVDGTLAASCPVGVGSLAEIEPEITFVAPTLRQFILCERNDG
jgi:hypothetical protein